MLGGPLVCGSRSIAGAVSTCGPSRSLQRLRAGFSLSPWADVGPKPTCRNVRDLVAIGWKADLTRTSNFGRD